MIQRKKACVLAFGAILVLGACTDPATLDPDNPNRNRDQGILAGALVGAGLGALASDDNTRGAIIGAAVGATAGGLIGSELDKQAAELRSELANDGITVTNTGDSLIVSVPQDITFDTDSFSVRPSLQSDLGRVADNLVKYPNSSVQIVGHTDSEGAADYNQGLSERRADAVANILMDGGVAPARVTSIGRGEEQPVASNLTPEGRAQNRRVDIIVVPEA